MMTFARIIAVILTIVVLGKAFLDYKKKRESIIMMIFWLFSWLGILIFSIKPDYLFWLNNKIGGKNSGVGTFLGVAFIFLFFVTYRVYLKANRLERQVRDLVMKIGLRDVE